MRAYKKEDLRLGKPKVLHLTTHMGGGIGRVLLSFFAEAKKHDRFEHAIVCLNYAEKEKKAEAKRLGVPLIDMAARKKRQLLKMIAEADLTMIHWWNHPLLYDFLVREQLPPSRVIVWSHVSGFYPPSVFSRKLLEYPDQFVFTTPISFEAEEVKKLPKGLKKKIKSIWSTAGVGWVISVRPKKHGGFNIGYVGTVDYAKLNPRFLDICSQIGIPRSKFIVCGGMDEKKIEGEANQLGIGKSFVFTGVTPKVPEYLSIFDVFGYPLSPFHFGTCDQTLQESMAAGVVPVVLANRMEKTMVKNGVTGLVAKNDEDYVRAVRKLYEKPKFKNRLSRNAREYAAENFSVGKMAREWEKIFENVLKIPKSSRKWRASKTGGLSAKDVFLESLGDHGGVFSDYCEAKTAGEKVKALRRIMELGKEAAWQSDSKGTVHNYNKFLPGDKILSFWSDVMKSGLDFGK